MQLKSACACKNNVYTNFLFAYCKFLSGGNPSTNLKCNQEIEVCKRKKKQKQNAIYSRFIKNYNECQFVIF